MSEDNVLELDLCCRPEAAISGGFLIQDEYKTFLTFNAVQLKDDGYYHNIGTAIVEFIGTHTTRFGLPNDEALEGHPLYKKGLHAYGIFEAQNSAWVKDLEAQNKVCFPNTSYSSLKHFIFTFHDSTFECVCREMKLEVSDEPFEQILVKLTSNILEY